MINAQQYFLNFYSVEYDKGGNQAPIKPKRKRLNHKTQHKFTVSLPTDVKLYDSEFNEIAVKERVVAKHRMEGFEHDYSLRDISKRNYNNSFTLKLHHNKHRTGDEGMTVLMDSDKNEISIYNTNPNVVW